MPHALLTGGAGFIGSHLAERLRSLPRWFSIIAGSVALTLLVWHAAPPRFFISDPSDFQAFHGPVAESLLAGRGLTADGVTPALRYPPGYAMLVAVTYFLADRGELDRQAALRVLNLVAGAVSALFVYELARAAGATLGALLSAALWMTYPLMLALSKAPMAEMPFAALLYAGLWLGLPPLWQGKARVGRGLAAGAVLGCVMLIRPIAIGLPVLLAVLAVLRMPSMKCGGRYAAVICFGALVVVAPWEAWVWKKTGRLILLSTGAAPSIRDGLTFAVHPGKPYRATRPVPEDVRAVQLAFLERYPRLRDVPTIAAAVFEQGCVQPVALARLLLWKAGRAWYGTDTGRHEGALLVLQGFYLALIIAGTTLAWRRPSARFCVFSLLVIVGCFWLMTTLVLSIARYMVPAMGLGFAVAGLGVRARPARGSAGDSVACGRREI